MRGKTKALVEDGFKFDDDPDEEKPEPELLAMESAVVNSEDILTLPDWPPEAEEDPEPDECEDPPGCEFDVVDVDPDVEPDADEAPEPEEDEVPTIPMAVA